MTSVCASPVPSFDGLADNPPEKCSSPEKLHDIRATYKYWCALNVGTDLIGQSQPTPRHTTRTLTPPHSPHPPPLHDLRPPTPHLAKTSPHPHLLPRPPRRHRRHPPHRRIPPIRHLLRRRPLVQPRSHHRRHRRLPPPLPRPHHAQRPPQPTQPPQHGTIQEHGR